MLRVFIGFDHRQPISYNVLQYSILKNSSVPVSITPLIYRQLPVIQKLEYWRDEPILPEEGGKSGLTPFTFSRFMVPYLCNYEGSALFIDIDMLVLGDLKDLFAQFDSKYSVQVVKHEQRFEWASAILFNCEKCKILTPEFINNTDGLHSFKWLKDDEIGSLPKEWNHLVGYDEERSDAELIHFTQGVPCHEEIGDCEYSGEWNKTVRELACTLPWYDLMGTSVHAEFYRGRVISKLLAKQKENMKVTVSLKN